MGNTIIGECTTCKNTSHQINFDQELNYNAVSDFRFYEVHSQKNTINIPKQFLPLKPLYQQYAMLLRQQNIQFQDTYFPCSEQTIGKYPNRRSSNIQWKRIPQIYESSNIYEKINQQNLSDSPQSPNNNIRKALRMLQKYPGFIHQIIPNITIIKEGIYLIYLCLNGKSKNRVEIVIDDKIPVISQTKKYIFGRGQAVWMLLIEKAFAKILKSYSKLSKLSPQEYFQQMVGIPLTNINNLQKQFPSNYFLQSYANQLNGQSSIYYKFTLQKTTSFYISIWQPRALFFQQSIGYLKIIAQLAGKTSPKGYQRKIYADTLIENKLILGQQQVGKKIDLNAGQYFIHIYSRYPRNISQMANLIVYSSSKVILRLRQQSFMRDLKNQMCENLFRNQVKKKRISIIKEEKSISTRFLWDKHRGILCIKNQYPSLKKFKIEILKHKIDQVSFQANSEGIITIEIQSDKQLLVYFVRKQDNDLGNFYMIIPL